MSDRQPHRPQNLWDRIKETDTFKNLQDNTQQMKQNYLNKQKEDEKKTLESPTSQPISNESKDDRPLLSRSDYQKMMREADSSSSTSRQESQARQKERMGGHSFLNRFDYVYGLIKKLLLMVVLALILIAMIAFGVGYGYFVSLLNHDIDLDQEELVQEVASVSSTSSMFFNDGRKIADLRSDLSRTPISIDQMSEDLLAAVIATEDSYFFEHDGVVPKAILRAVFEQLTNTGNTGGSTITQQLVKQQLLTDETTFERKANEIALSLELEELLSKDEILETYLNVSPFGRNNQGQNIAGVEEAAEGIFGVEASDLSIPQAAFIAGLPKSPIEYSPYDQHGRFKADMSAGIDRQKDVLFFMFREGYLSVEDYQAAEAYDIAQDFQEPEPPNDANRTYLYDEVERRSREIIMELMIEEDGRQLDQVKDNQDLFNDYYQRADADLRNGGYEIKTTIDRDIHLALKQTIEDNAWYIGSPREVYWADEESGEEHYMVDYAQNGSVLLDNASGQIIAFVGGVNYDDNNVNHATQSRRSPASILKPLSVYGPALELGVITPASMVYDRPISFSSAETGGAPYEPGNAGGFTHRWWHAREALVHSQNIPAIRIYNEFYKTHDIKPYFRQAGIGPEAIPDQDFATLSLSLGGVTHGTTVEEMVGVYAAIANDGQYVEPYMIESIKDPHGEVIFQIKDHQEINEVFREDTAYILQDILRDVSRYGTGQTSRAELQFSIDLMSKTGTSNNHRDIWYVGSNPQITLGSWIGYSNIMANNDLAREFDGSPSSRNQRIWSRLMNAIYQTKPELMGLDQEFDQPDSIVTDSVLQSTGMKPGQVTLPNGRTIHVNGAMKEEIFLHDFVPGETVYDFAIDSTEEELQRFWSAYLRPPARSDSSDDDEEDEDEEDLKEEEDEDNGDEDEEESSIIGDIIDGIREQFEN